MEKLGFLGDGKIYLNEEQRTNVYKYGEEIHSLYRALNNLDASVGQIQMSLDEIEKTKEEIRKRITALEEEVMKMGNK